MKLSRMSLIQAVRRQAFTAEVWVRSQASQCGI